MKTYLLAFLFLVLATGCGGGSEPATPSGDGDSDTDTTEQTTDLDGDSADREADLADGDESELTPVDGDEADTELADNDVLEFETEVKASLVIVTTNAIAQDSARLEAFAQEKRARGFATSIVTEAQYGSAGKKGLERAIAIRTYLQSVYESLPTPRYLLLIGDAHAAYGDVPMFEVWPRSSYPANDCVGAFAIDCRHMESDLPYGDMLGNWDKNGNALWGEHELDEGADGMRFASEWAIGRLPVYFGETAPLDRLLDFSIAYGRQNLAETAYRTRLLLPASFYYFKGQKLSATTMAVDVDGAAEAEWFVHNALGDFPDLSITRLYEREGVRPSAYESEGALTEDNVVAEWSKGGGMVFWFGHGLERGVYRTIWSADANADGLPDDNEMEQPYLLSSEAAARITSGKPAFVVAVSCEVGSAETPDNLSYALLLSGAAIGVVGSTNVTPGDATFYTDLDAPLDTQSYGAVNLGIYLFPRLLRGMSASQALVDSRVALGTSGVIESDAGRLMLNYFGDPTLTLEDHAL